MLNAAAGLFVANGFVSTTMDDIAAAVSLNKGTLYYYYDSKAAILFDIIFRIEEGRLEAVRNPREDLDPSELLRNFIEETAIYILDNPISARISTQESPFLDLWLTAEQLAVLARCHDEFQKHLLQLIAQNLGGANLNDAEIKVAAQVITGSLVWLPRWYRPKGSLSKEAVASRIASVILSGIMPREAATAEAAPRRGKSAGGRRSAQPAAEKAAAPARPRTEGRNKAQERRNRAAAVNRELT